MLNFSEWNQVFFHYSLVIHWKSVSKKSCKTHKQNLVTIVRKLRVAVIYKCSTFV